jgi:hypothetical protein
LNDSKSARAARDDAGYTKGYLDARSLAAVNSDGKLFAKWSKINSWKENSDCRDVQSTLPANRSSEVRRWMGQYQFDLYTPVAAAGEVLLV